MRTTTNYELNLAEGTDRYNHLTVDNPNYEKIDTQMKTNEMNGVPKATEIKSATVHAITRTVPDSPMFHFTATSNYTAGDTFTVDGIQVTGLLPSGETPGSGAYIIGAEVLCFLRESVMTMFVPTGTVAVAADSEKLGGNLPEYYGTAEGVEGANALATAANQISIANQQSISQINTAIEGLKNPPFNTGIEEKIGTLNGKDVYRKRLLASNVSISTTTIIDNVVTYDYVDTLLSVSGTARIAQNRVYPLNFNSGSPTVVMNCDLTENGIRLDILGYRVIAYFVELIYTKA